MVCISAFSIGLPYNSGKRLFIYSSGTSNKTIIKEYGEGCCQMGEASLRDV